MNINPLSIAGCFLIEPQIRKDERGFFIKNYHADSFKESGIDTIFKESYYSFSRKGVLRGMHFQTPPHDHSKYVYCSQGSVLDVFLDLRKNSPTYGQSSAITLSADNGHALFLPTGIAHGFFALEDACMHYNTSSVYAPQNDKGVHWQSITQDWPEGIAPLVSPRDEQLPYLKDFQSPF